MGRLTNIIFITGFVLCSTVISLNRETIDYSNEVRTLILGITTLSLFAVMACRAKAEDLAVIRNPIFAVYFIYWLAVTFSIVLAGNIGEAAYGSVKVFTLMFYLYGTAVKLKDDDRGFAKSLILVNIGLGLLAVYQFIYKEPHMRIGLMAGVNFNAQAFFLLGILCVHYRRRWKVPAAMAIVLSAFAIITLQSRAVWLAVFAAAVVFAFSNRKYILIGLVGSTMTAALVFVYLDSHSNLDLRSLEQRIDIWTQTGRMIKDHPMGVGAGNWQVKFPVYSGFLKPLHRDVVYNDRKFYTQNHNDPQQILAEIGPAGFLVYLLMFIFAMRYSSGWVRAAIAGYMVISLFDFPAERAFHPMMLMILFAIAIKEVPAFRIEPGRRWYPVVAGTVAAVLIFSVYDFAVRYESSRQTRRIYNARIDTQWKTMVTETSRISPLASIDPQSTTPLLFYRGLGYFYQGDLKKATIAFAGAQKVNPNHLFSVMNMAYCYVLSGELDKADEYYQRAKKMYPDFAGVDKALHAMNALTGRLIGEGS